jgi:hypothetical protein
MVREEPDHALRTAAPRAFRSRIGMAFRPLTTRFSPRWLCRSSE